MDRALVLLRLIGRQNGPGTSLRGNHGSGYGSGHGLVQPMTQGVTLSALVQASGLNKPTVRRLVLALIRAGLVEQDAASRAYHLGPEAYVLGTLAARRHGLLEIVAPALRRMVQKTEDAAFLSVRRGVTSVCLHREEGTYPIRTHALQTGQEHPLGVGAGSLAMLAAMPEGEIDQAIAANESVLRESYPLLPPSRVRQLVTETRDKGYALNPGLIFADSWGLGIALRFPDGRIAGALSLAAIESRMQPPRRDMLIAVLRKEADQMQARLMEMFGASGQKQIG